MPLCKALAFSVNPQSYGYQHNTQNKNEDCVHLFKSYLKYLKKHKMDYANIQNIFLFYSNFSNACKQLLAVLTENNLSFIRPVCIDNPILRNHVSTRISKVPALSIIYGDGRAELIQGKDSFVFIEQLVRDSRPPPPPSPPVQETVTRLPEFDETPSPPPSDPQTKEGMEFNMVSAMSNKYTNDGVPPTSYEPKSLAENHPRPDDKDDLQFKMLEPVRSQDKIQQTLSQPAPPPAKSDDSKLDIQKILDSAKIAN
jgi:hypothetical protein